MTNTEKLSLTKKDLNKVLFRGMLLQLSWNYERMQALGYCYTCLLYTSKTSDEICGMRDVLRLPPGCGRLFCHQTFNDPAGN